jgi:tRNA1(Val) A37 N6-methylase TrmN6
MNYHVIDSITLMKAIELIDQYNWHLNNISTTNTDAAQDARLVLNSLRNCLKTTTDNCPEYE